MGSQALTCTLVDALVYKTDYSTEYDVICFVDVTQRSLIS